jgi:hypothetical protein
VALSIRTGIPYKDLIDLPGDIIITYLELLNERDSDG